MHVLSVPQDVAIAQPKIAVIAPSLAILGGQGIQAAALMDELRQSGFSITFIAIDAQFPAGLGWVRKIPYLRTALNQLLYRWRLRQLRNVDQVHLFSASYWSFVLSQIPAIRAARRYNKPIILNYHSGEAEDHLLHWGRRVHPWLKRVDHIVVPSVYLKDVFRRFGYQAQVIPNMIHLDQFEFRVRNPLRPRLLSIRNLEAIYCVWNTLKAFSLVQQRIPQATLTIAGYGSQEAWLRKMVDVHQINNVTFIGRIEPEQIAAVYNAHDIFINSSIVDNQPVSILEAFAAGLPVISTPTGDIGNMIQTGINGMLVPTGSPEAISNATMHLLDNQEATRRMVLAAHETAARFTWSETRRDWIQLFSKVQP